MSIEPTHTEATHTETAHTEPVGTLFLVRARTALEKDLVAAHLEERQDTGRIQTVVLPRTPVALSELARLLEENWLLQPVGVLWRPGERRDGRRLADAKELLRGINPYRPSQRQQASILKRSTDRARVTEGIPATAEELRDVWQTKGHHDGDLGFASHVVRRARLALEHAERGVLGPVYKSPTLVKAEILDSERFHRGLRDLIAEVGSEKASVAEAENILNELATGWSRLAADLVPSMYRRTFDKGFDSKIDVDPDEIDRLRTTLNERATIFLWSHRSNMDNPVLTLTLHDEGLPMPHTFAGINMAFGPMGMVFRRAGTIFIRRNIGDDPLYKHVLQEFVGYLVERRFDLSWAIEGTRSRTGKMLPPKLGLLTYAAKAYMDGRTDDISLQPVAITFDQLDEIEEYAKYASGATKKAEGYAWIVNYIQDQGKRNFGKAYVRFPEPVSMRSFLGDPEGEVAQDPAKRRLALQKMAFEVAWRINQATPVTPTALITSLLLGSRGLGLTLNQTHAGLQPTLDHLQVAGLPAAAGVASLRERAGVEAALDALTSGGPVTVVRKGRETVWLIEPAKQLAATFYRNSVIHVFLNAAITEVSALSAAQAADRGEDAVAEFWRCAYRLRDLLKFEFYFNAKDEHRRDLESEMLRFGTDWEAALCEGVDRVNAVLLTRLPLTSSFTIRPFLEAYLIVADVLAHVEDLPERKHIIKIALGLGEQYVAQRRVSSREPVSALLFDTALQLFAQQGLLEDSPDRATRTKALMRELQGILRLITEIEQVAETSFLTYHATLDTQQPAPLRSEIFGERD